MAVIQVRMVTGWAADPYSLKQLMKSTKKIGLKRYDVDENNDVQLYFSKVSRLYCILRC